MDAYAVEAQSKMEKSIESFKISLGKLRSGKANPSVLKGIQCDYYGDKMDIDALCSVAMPEPRQLLVKPYSKEDLKSIGAAIAAANIGINPQIEADCIRLIFPALTTDLRQQIAKQAKGLSDDAKVSIRNIRRDYLDLVKIDDGMSDDYKELVEKDIQKCVDAANKKIEEILAEKQKEILSI